MEQIEFQSIEQSHEASKSADGSNNNEAKESIPKPDVISSIVKEQETSPGVISPVIEKKVPEADVAFSSTVQVLVPKYGLASTAKVKKPVKRKRKTTEQKIDEAERYRDRCIERIKIMEEKELDADDDGVTLETIDKLRKKVMEFEEVICAYFESDFDCKNTKSSNVFSKIFITSTGLEPLNQFLTELVNDIVTKEHVCAGYRCITFDDVDGQIKRITESNECPIVSIVVPSDEIKREEFIIGIVDSVNSHCRKLRYGEFFAEQEANRSDKDIGVAGDIAFAEAAPVSLPPKKDTAVDNLLDASLNAVLLNMKHEGEIEIGDYEVGDCIDLSKEGSDEDEEADEADECAEEDKENEDAKDDAATSESDVQELLSQPVPDIGDDNQHMIPEVVGKDDDEIKNEKSEQTEDTNNVARSDCAIDKEGMVHVIQATARERSIETIEIDDSESEKAIEGDEDDDDSIQILFQHTS